MNRMDGQAGGRADEQAETVETGEFTVPFIPSVVLLTFGLTAHHVLPRRWHGPRLLHTITQSMGTDDETWLQAAGGRGCHQVSGQSSSAWRGRTRKTGSR